MNDVLPNLDKHIPTMHYSLAPSLPAQSWDELSTLWSAFGGRLPELQVDIVDGVFVPHTSWPFTEAEGMEALTKLSEFSGTELEIDCMCMHPESYLDLFASLHVARVVIHAESTAAYEQCVAHGNLHGYKVGLGVRVTTPPALVDSLVPLFSYVQVMGIRHVGAQGQPFDPEALTIITRLRHAYPLLEIAVDGAVNEHTIPKLLQAGANRFAPGSAIAKSDDPVASYKQLCELLPH